MSRKRMMLRASQAAIAMLLSAGAAQAQEPTEVGEVVVTGSFIQGTPEDAALPVEVITAEELQKKGSPTMVEIIKALTVSSGVLGESNQFSASGRGQAGEGSATVNLRGLGAERTLVLLNGRRVAFSDLNTLPQNAIGRVEVLKDGAAATYGSDAIGGVVNFITRTNQRGLEVYGDYRYVKGTDGQYNGGATFGWSNDSGLHVLLAGNYQLRTDLSSRDRDWALVPYAQNPDAAWSGASSPTSFTPIGADYRAVGARFVDVGCTPLGGVITQDNNCRFQAIPWDNIVEHEERYQLYAEVRYDITDNLTAFVEGLYGHTWVPSVNTTPSYATSRGPTETVLPAGFLNTPGYATAAPDSPNASNFYYVPFTNPGFAPYCNANPTQCPAGTAGAIITVGTWRPFFASGNPLFDNKGSSFSREREQYRISGGFEGKLGEMGFLGDVGFQANLGYSRYYFERNGYDSLTGRLQLALRGLGGPNCNPATGTPGVGSCFYLNPFSNAIQVNPTNGATNPGYNASVANTNKDLVAWFFTPADQSRQVTELWEGNLIFNGQLGINLPGGQIGWAAGGQWRQNKNSSSPEPGSSTVATPCADTPINGSTVCTPRPFSPFVFLGNVNPNDTSRDVYAGFVELQLPITDALNVQLSARYEDYGKFGGETFNPQARGKWQINDMFAVRGAVGSTFRAPPLLSLIPDTGVALSNVFGTFRPIETTGNPDLTPEKAFTYTFGGLIQTGRFRASVDYWYFRLKDILTTEPLNPLLNAAFGPTGAVTPANCSDPFITSHFTFSAPECTSANIATVRIQQINGPTTKTSGLDFLATYDVDDFMGGSLQVGGSLSYTLKYDVSALVVNGVTFSPALKAVGYANFGNSLAFPLPQWKAEVYAEFNRSIHNFRWTLRYIDSYIDQRTANFAQTAANTQISPTPAVPASTLVTAGKKIKEQVQNDFAYRAQLPWDTTVTVAIQNVFDKDPPFARTELSYDALTGNPLGRTIQVGVRKKF